MTVPLHKKGVALVEVIIKVYRCYQLPTQKSHPASFC